MIQLRADLPKVNVASGALAFAASLLIAYSPSIAVAQCAGDCDDDHRTTIDELARGVGMSLGDVPLSSCPSFDADGTGSIEAPEVVKAVLSALHGCGRASTPTPETPVATPSPTLTPTGTRAASVSPSVTRSASRTASPSKSPSTPSPSTPSPSPSLSATRSPSPTPTRSPTIHSTPGEVLTIGGACRKPLGTELVDCDVGTAVRCLRCGDNATCLADSSARMLLGAANVTSRGAFTLTVDAAAANGARLILEADVENAVIFRTISFGRLAAGGAGLTLDDVVVDPTSEASVRALERRPGETADLSDAFLTTALADARAAVSRVFQSEANTVAIFGDQVVGQTAELLDGCCFLLSGGVEFSTCRLFASGDSGPCYCAGDRDGTQDVSGVEVAVCQQIAAAQRPLSDSPFCDTDGDGIVDSGDLAIVQMNHDLGCPGLR
jgi:hypothetical protein